MPDSVSEGQQKVALKLLQAEDYCDKIDKLAANKMEMLDPAGITSYKPDKKMRRKNKLSDKYPPSPPCACDICLAYCARPGWWTVEEAARAIAAGYGRRMMLEMAPDFSFGVLAPAFKGCELAFALNIFAHRGCTFLNNNHCELHGTGFQPLECRYCHHERRGLGQQCHADLEQDWHTAAGRTLVVKWSKLTGFWQRLDIFQPAGQKFVSSTEPQLTGRTKGRFVWP